MSFFPFAWPFAGVPGRSSHMYDNNESYERHLLQQPHYMYIRPFEKPRSIPQSTKDKTVNLLGTEGFQVSLNVQNFAPNEITVKAINNCIVVEGKHEEREDDHGFIYRHFVRRYELPKECNSNQVSSSLSSDGILTVKSPRVSQSNERIIDVIQTGPAHLTIKDNPKEKTKEIPKHCDGKNEKKNKI